METLPPKLDLEATPVQGQLACSVLDLDGNIVGGQMNQHDSSLLFQMLVESTNLEERVRFRRVTVTFTNTRYVVSMDESHIYIIHTSLG